MECCSGRGGHAIFQWISAEFENTHKEDRPMEKIDWNPGNLLQLSGSYWQALTLHAGVKLDIFSHLAQGPLSAEALAERLKADIRGMTILLNALSAMQLIEKTRGSLPCKERGA